MAKLRVMLLVPLSIILLLISTTPTDAADYRRLRDSTPKRGGELGEEKKSEIDQLVEKMSQSWREALLENAEEEGRLEELVNAPANEKKAKKAQEEEEKKKLKEKREEEKKAKKQMEARAKELKRTLSSSAWKSYAAKERQKKKEEAAKEKEKKKLEVMEKEQKMAAYESDCRVITKLHNIFQRYTEKQIDELEEPYKNMARHVVLLSHNRLQDTMVGFNLSM